MLLRLLCSLAGGVLVRLGVVELNGGEDGVVEAAVDAGDGVDDGVGLVCLEGGGDCEAGGSVTIEDIDELLLLTGSDHDSTALGVYRNVLAGDDAAAARLAEGLLVDLVEGILLLVVLEDDDAAGVGANDDIVLLRAGEAELGEGADCAEDLDRVDGLDLAGVIRAEEVEDLAAGDDDLLGFAAHEVAIDCADDPGGLLECEAVEIHGEDFS